MSRRPPKLTGRIHGLRTWDLASRHGSLRLEAIASPYVWRPAATLKARCSGSRHPAPHPECECGFYAHHPDLFSARTLEQSCLRSAPYETAPTVAGIVEAWGRVELHASGFRSEFMRPLALVRFASFDRAFRALVAAMAEQYDAEVVDVEDAAELIGRCRALGLGLDPERVERLVDSDEPLAFGLSATIDHRERSARFGYWPDLCGPVPVADALATVGDPGVRVLRIDLGSSPGSQSPTLNPGELLDLTIDRTPGENPRVAVWDAGRKRRAGHLSEEVAAEVARDLDHGRIRGAWSLCHWRDLEAGKRTALGLLFCTPRAAERLEFDDETPLEDEIPF